MDHSHVPPTKLRHRCDKLTRQQGDAWVALQLGCSRPTFARLLAGLGVMPTTLALAEARIDAAEQAAARDVA